MVLNEMGVEGYEDGELEGVLVTLYVSKLSSSGAPSAKRGKRHTAEAASAGERWARE
jgi:hypothetical protein